MLVAGGHQPDANGLFSSIDEERYRHAFAKVYGDVFPETFSPVAAEGMFFTNNPLMSEILVRSFEGQSTGQIVESAFTVALGRSPDPGERAAGTSFLGETPVPSKATALLWALIAGSEFRFNH